MATKSLQAESACASPLSRSTVLYHAYRHATAAWFIQLYAPEHLTVDLPEEVNERLSEAHTVALETYLLEPTSNLRELARKLQIFRDEGVQHYASSDDVVEVLAADARRVMRALDTVRHA